MRALRGASSLREMADAIGIKYSAWARYENGDVLPGAEIISKICRAHACSADWLLGLDRGKCAASVKTGNNSAVAIGANARATVRGTSAPLLGHPLRGLAPLGGYAPGEMPACSKCPYKKRWQKIESMK